MHWVPQNTMAHQCAQRLRTNVLEVENPPAYCVDLDSRNPSFKKGTKYKNHMKTKMGLKISDYCFRSCCGKGSIDFWS